MAPGGVCNNSPGPDSISAVLSCVGMDLQASKQQNSSKGIGMEVQRAATAVDGRCTAHPVAALNVWFADSQPWGWQ